MRFKFLRPATNVKAVFILLLAVCIYRPAAVWAQAKDTVGNYSVSAYADVYYALYTDSLGKGKYQKFPTVSPRSNQPGLNIIQVSGKYDGNRIRGMLTLQYGDIPKTTWPSDGFRYLQEAHVGVKLLKPLWLDVGFFRTHFGTEFLLPVENLTSSVSVGTYYEPYYESGARLNFDPTSKLEINLFLLNGYGIFSDNNRKKSFGMGITYNLFENGNIGYTNYLGDDSPDGSLVPHTRFHENAFINYQHSHLKLQAGVDFCVQQNADIATGTRPATMYSGLVTAKYACGDYAAVYGRLEFFHDPAALMSPLITDVDSVHTGYKLWGFTAGGEYRPIKNAYIRLESRVLMLNAFEPIFRYDNGDRSYRFELMVNAGITLDVLKGAILR